MTPLFPLKELMLRTLTTVLQKNLTRIHNLRVYVPDLVIG